MTEKTYSLPLLRRFYQRYELEAQATLIVNRESQRPSILKDLSAIGAGIISNQPLDVNERVEVIMVIPYFFAFPVYREAKVIWCNRLDERLWQAGLNFGWDNKIDL